MVRRGGDAFQTRTGLESRSTARRLGISGSQRELPGWLSGGTRRLRTGLLARYPEATQRAVSARQPVLMAGVGKPPDKAIPTEGGFVLAGAWNSASGVDHAEWVQIPATIDGGDHPMQHLCPRADVEVLDTWHMAGMQGTGSPKIRVRGKFVPEHRMMDFEVWPSRPNPGSQLHPEPLYSCGFGDLLTFFPTPAVGAAEVMLEGYRQRFEYRRAPFSPTLTTDTVAGQYARAVSSLRTAQAVLEHTLDDVMRSYQETSEAMPDELGAQWKLDLLTVLRTSWQSIQIGAGRVRYLTVQDRRQGPALRAGHASGAEPPDHRRGHDVDQSGRNPARSRGLPEPYGHLRVNLWHN